MKLKPTKDLLLSISEYMSVCVGACLGRPTRGPRQHGGDNADVWVQYGLVHIIVSTEDVGSKVSNENLKVLNRMVADFGFGKLCYAGSRNGYESYATLDDFMSRVDAFYLSSGKTYVVFGERNVRGLPTPRSKCSVPNLVKTTKRELAGVPDRSVVVDKTDTHVCNRATRSARHGGKTTKRIACSASV